MAELSAARRGKAKARRSPPHPDHIFTIMPIASLIAGPMTFADKEVWDRSMQISCNRCKPCIQDAIDQPDPKLRRDCGFLIPLANRHVCLLPAFAGTACLTRSVEGEEDYIHPVIYEALKPD